jgi:hypothetical protein
MNAKAPYTIVQRVHIHPTVAGLSESLHRHPAA